MGRKKENEIPRLGKQPPRYKFFLNPYQDARFTRCPKCDAKTRQKKLPLVIHIDDWGMFVLNKTCRFCPDCQLLIAHQDELEGYLAAFFEQQAPEIVGNDYLVIGTGGGRLKHEARFVQEHYRLAPTGRLFFIRGHSTLRHPSGDCAGAVEVALHCNSVSWTN